VSGNNYNEVAEAVIRILIDRYGMPPHRVVDAIKWVEERMEANASSKRASTNAIIVVVTSALALVLWTGVKNWLEK